jgi:hypothetical protein
VDPVDDLVFPVALVKADLDVMFAGDAAAFGFDVGQGS